MKLSIRYKKRQKEIITFSSVRRNLKVPWLDLVTLVSLHALLALAHAGVAVALLGHAGNPAATVRAALAAAEAPGVGLVGRETNLCCC